MRPKSLEDIWKLEEIDKIRGQPWDPSVTLTQNKLVQDRFPKIKDPTVEEEYDYMPRSHKITNSGLVSGRDGRKGRKCRAMKGEASTDSLDTLSMMWPRSFRRRKFAVEPVHEDFEEDGVLRVMLCVHCPAKNGICRLRRTRGKRGTLFYKTEPKLFIAFLPRICSGLEFKSGRHGSEHVCLLLVSSSVVRHSCCGSCG